MAFVKSKGYDNAIQKIRVEFGDLLGLASPAEAYIVLREMPSRDMIALNEKRNTEKELMDFYSEILPHLIVEHNLYETDTEKMTNQAVVELVYDKIDITLRVLNSYTGAAFFTRMTAKKGK